jgi:hypothetical protein
MGSLFGSRPKVDTSAVEDLSDEQEETKNKKTALLATAGGQVGEEVTGVKKRDTLLGN